MSSLRNSVVFLFFFLLLVFEIAQANYIQETVVSFNPVFFVLITLATLSGILIRPGRRFSIYAFLILWGMIYGLVWVFYWRAFNIERNQVLVIQFVLVEISAGLAFDVGRQLGQVSDLLEGLTRATYPNRTLDLAAAGDRISAELTRSRRYHHPLSLLVIETRGFNASKTTDYPVLQRDILSKFAAAKVGQVINDRTRETDLIMRDDQGRVIILCPETNYESSLILARRIEEGISSVTGADISWGSAFFPSEALAFDDLILRARERLENADHAVPATPPADDDREDQAKPGHNDSS